MQHNLTTGKEIISIQIREVSGTALKDFAQRDEIVIAAKVFNLMSPASGDAGLSRKNILKSVDDGIRLFRTVA